MLAYLNYLPNIGLLNLVSISASNSTSINLPETLLALFVVSNGLICGFGIYLTTQTDMGKKHFTELVIETIILILMLIGSIVLQQKNEILYSHLSSIWSILLLILSVAVGLSLRLFIEVKQEEKRKGDKNKKQ